MANIDLEAVREAIGRAVGDDEVWHLVETFEAPGRGGTVTVKLWQHPQYGYRVTGVDEEGDETHGNHEADPVLAVEVGHLGRFRPAD